MMDSPLECVLCRGAAGDAELQRLQVWEDSLWRLTVSLDAEVLAFSYLEPKRHIQHITDLNGEEARTFGEVLSLVSSVLQEETRAELVYVYIFGGGVPHLHVHLAPHKRGDALNAQMIRGEFSEERLESGAVRYASREFPPLPQEQQQAVAKRIGQRLMGALAQRGAAAVNPLIIALKDESLNIRVEVAKALGQVDDERAIIALIESLKDDALAVRAWAADSLGKLSGTAVRPLIEALEDEHLSTRGAALQTLEKLGRSSIIAFMDALKDEDPGTRAAALMALGKIGDAIVGSLIGVLEDGSVDAGAEAIRVLAKLGSAAEAGSLIKEVEDENPGLQTETAQRLGRRSSLYLKLLQIMIPGCGHGQLIL